MDGADTPGVVCLISIKKRGSHVNCLNAKKQPNLAEGRGVSFLVSYDAAFSVNEQSAAFAQEHHQSQQDIVGMWSQYFISLPSSPSLSLSTFQCLTCTHLLQLMSYKSGCQ